MPARPIVVSTGFNRTHMTIAAREVSDRGLLDVAITGAYPTDRVKRNLSRLGLADRGRVARLLERDEKIPDEVVRAQLAAELLDETARLVTRIPAGRRLYSDLTVACMRLYGARAATELKRRAPGPEIYHFRAGFGHRSVPVARELGMVALCDHSAPHPRLIDSLIDAEGRRPTGPAAPAAEPRHPLWRAMLSDIDRADAVLVNSDSLKRDFLSLGWDAERIHVAYLGVDDHFLRHAAGPTREPRSGPLRLIFAGRFEPAKGADALEKALGSIELPWELVLAGPISTEDARRYRRFLDDPRVTALGTIDRARLAGQMREADVFVFPSLAEGSARVVFEALACGCYVITTPDSGSIVEDGVHGALVGADAAGELAGAISSADSDRGRLAETGNRNAALVAEHYRQTDYGARLAEVYAKLSRRTERTYPAAGSRSPRPSASA